MNSRKNKILVLLGFWWLFIALLMPFATGTINQKVQGFVIMGILAIIHFFSAKNYIMFYFSKDSKNLRKEIRKKEFNQFKTELKNKNNQMNLIKCPQCNCLINANNTFCTACGKQLNYYPLIANKNINKNDFFCSNCDTKLKDDNLNIEHENIISSIYNDDKKSIIDDKIDYFNQCLYNANKQKTKEILEALIELDNLDNAFLEVRKVKPNFMKRNSYEESKINILDNIISDKFRKYSSNKKIEIENMKSLLDELLVCKRRYPEYKEIFEKHITNIQTKFLN